MFQQQRKTAAQQVTICREQHDLLGESIANTDLDKPMDRMAELLGKSKSVSHIPDEFSTSVSKSMNVSSIERARKDISASYYPRDLSLFEISEHEDSFEDVVKDDLLSRDIFENDYPMEDPSIHHNSSHHNSVKPSMTEYSTEKDAVLLDTTSHRMPLQDATFVLYRHPSYKETTCTPTPITMSKQHKNRTKKTPSKKLVNVSTTLDFSVANLEDLPEENCSMCNLYPQELSEEPLHTAPNQNSEHYCNTSTPMSKKQYVISEPCEPRQEFVEQWLDENIFSTSELSANDLISEYGLWYHTHSHYQKSPYVNPVRPHHGKSYRTNSRFMNSHHRKSHHLNSHRTSSHYVDPNYSILKQDFNEPQYETSTHHKSKHAISDSHRNPTHAIEKRQNKSNMDFDANIEYERYARDTKKRHKRRLHFEKVEKVKKVDRLAPEGSDDDRESEWL